MPRLPLNVDVPRECWEMRYDPACFPGSLVQGSTVGRANCQKFAYEILRRNHFVVPDLRSKELWADTEHSDKISEDFKPFDLLLFNRNRNPWGAHVAVFTGSGEAIHLSKQIGFPVIWKLEQFTEHPEYKCLIGAKRFRHLDL